LNFSPVASEVLASGGFDNTVNVWNIQNSNSYSKIQFNDGIYSLDWNADGSMLGAITKEKIVYLIDPRQNKIEASCKGHESGKIQKMLFLKGDYLFSCGFSKSNERQIKLYDTRNFSDAVQAVSVDTQNGIMLPFWDPDTGLIFVPGKGEGNIKFFEFSEGTVKYAGAYSGSTQQKGMAMFPKRSMNYNKCEIDRFAKLTVNSIEYLSFLVPKRNEGYDASIYPDCISGEPAISVDDWLSGQNKPAIRKPITSIESTWNVSSDIHFEKKVEEVIKDEKLLLHEKIGNLQNEIENLNNKLTEYEQSNDLLTNEISQLKEELQALKEKN